MKDFKDAYIIVKVLTKPGGKPQHVFLVNSHHEILELRKRRRKLLTYLKVILRMVGNIMSKRFNYEK